MTLREMIKPCPNFSSLLSSLGACIFRIIILHARPLRNIYDILCSLNCWYFAVCTKLLFSVDDFHFLFLRTNYNPKLSIFPLSYLTSCRHTEYYLYLANSLVAAAVSNFLLTFLDNMFVWSSRVKDPLNMGPTFCPEKFLRNYYYSQPNSPEVRSS
jgi:hypothetical protein